MPQKYTCTCRSCVDPREHGFFIQHGLALLNEFYMSRVKGAFIPKPNSTHDISTTDLMLLQMGRNPLFVVQGHRDCAAVKILFDTHNKNPNTLSETEREFLRSQSTVLELVKRIAADLPDEDQLMLLEKTCVLQSINNLFEYEGINQKEKYQPQIYAYYSFTSKSTEERPSDPSKIGLMVYDQKQGAFVRSAASKNNNGIRIVDLINPKTFEPFDHDRFMIKEPIALEATIRNEAHVVREHNDRKRPYRRLWRLWDKRSSRQSANQQWRQ